MKSEVEKAVRVAGGKAALAALAGVSERTVDNWRARGGMPATRASLLERLLRGAVRARRLLVPGVRK